MGNMCYENGLNSLHFYFLLIVYILADGCELVFNTIGIESLFNVCRFSCQSNEPECGQLRMMTLGALHNIINSNGKVAPN